MKTVGVDSFPLEPLFFQQKLATLQTRNSANFKNILNRLSMSPIDVFEGGITVFWDYFNCKNNI